MADGSHTIPVGPLGVRFLVEGEDSAGGVAVCAADVPPHPAWAGAVMRRHGLRPVMRRHGLPPLPGA